MKKGKKNNKKNNWTAQLNPSPTERGYILSLQTV